MKPDETELEMVERHVASGDRIIACQRALIARLATTGSHYDAARALLATFIETQALHRQHLARLRR